jgi:hypothetical protein
MKKLIKELLYYEDGSERDPCYEVNASCGEYDTCFFCHKNNRRQYSSVIHAEDCIWIKLKKEFDNDN